MTGADAAPALNWLDGQSDAMTALLRELVRIPSDNPPGDCAPHAERTARLLGELGLAVEQHPVPPDIVRRHGMVSATNLIVRQHFGEGPVLALNAHGDVVPPGEGWSCDPYAGEVRDGWMYGRGAAVSKSDIASYAFALKALAETAPGLAGTVELHVTYDEEIGGHVGPAWILENGLSRPDYAICAAFSYSVVTAHNGCLHLEVTVRGRSAHAALPDSGNDAIEGATRLLQAVYAYRDGLRERHSRFEGIDHPTCVVGLVSGGINTNVVPDRVTLRIDRRITPDENPDAVERELSTLLRAQEASLGGCAVEVTRVLLARPLVPVPGAEAFAERVRSHAERMAGEPIPCVAIPLYTDARHYAERNIPTVMYGAGPRTLLEANGHRADERVPLETIPLAARTICAVVMDLLTPTAR